MAIRHEVLIQTEDARVRVMHLSPAESTILHHHTVVTDHMVGLEGEVRINLKGPDEAVVLQSGERCMVQPGRVHQVINSNSAKSASYLLIQGVGRYDFVPD